MRNLDADLVKAALKKGLIDAEGKERVESLVQASKGKAYAAQILVRERIISTRQLLSLQNLVRANLYECPHCQRRHTRKELPKKKGKRFDCRACGKSIRLERKQATLSRIEVLSSRDPRDLSVPLTAEGESEASDVSQLDLDRYDVADELGRGGYGVVFKAFHRDLERDVALKVLRSGPTLPPTALERFLREGRAASRLRHPNIVGVYDIGRHRDLFALAMEYVPGESLKQYLKRRGRVPWREAAELMVGILAGVAHAHEQGIIHRDLKPTNIIIEEETGRPRLIDFGLARDLHADSTLTGAGAIVGTPFYLSPEQIRGHSAESDARSDVFALGVILYELLAGKRPFSSRLKNEVYAMILKEEPQPLGERVEDLPPALEEVVATAMAKDADERYDDAPAMRLAIEAVLAEADEGGPPAPRAGKKRTTRRKRRSGVRAGTRSVRTAPPRPGGSGGARVAVAAAAGVVVLGLGFLLGKGGAATIDAEHEHEVAAATATPEPPEPAPEVRDPNPEIRASEPEIRAPEPEIRASSPDPEIRVPSPEPEDDSELEAELEPEDEPEDEAEYEAEPEPEPEDEPEPDPELEPEPPGASPEPVELDRGKNDPKEFPELADRSQRDWLKRAFFLNVLTEGTPTPRVVRALRFGLSDRFALNRAFALRGLAACPDDLLVSAGSQALFEGLVDQLGEEEPYVARTTRALLLRLAGGGEPKSKSEWKRWWRDEGELRFQEAARNPPDVRIAPREEVAQTERLATRTRTVTEYFSQIRDQGLDLVFVLDVTLSMTDELDRMRRQVNEITSFMDLLLKGKVRMGFVTYGDAVVKRVPLTKKLPLFAREIEQIKIFNDPNDRTIEEGVSVALEDVLGAENRLQWRRKARRTIVLLGDAPPLDPDQARAMANIAAQGKFILNAIVAPSPPKYAHKSAEPSFRELADLGGGTVALLKTPEELITRILVMALGSKEEGDLRRFVYAYREVTGAANLPEDEPLGPQ